MRTTKLFWSLASVTAAAALVVACGGGGSSSSNPPGSGGDHMGTGGDDGTGGDGDTGGTGGGSGGSDSGSAGEGGMNMGGASMGGAGAVCGGTPDACSTMTTSITCDAQDGCGVSGTCVGEGMCGDHMDSGSCEEAECSWMMPCQPTLDCSTLMTLESCDAIGNCDWDPDEEECVAKESGGCADMLNPGSCTSLVGCAWNQEHFSCDGTATECSEFSTEECSDQMGCLVE